MFLASLELVSQAILDSFQAILADFTKFDLYIFNHIFVAQAHQANNHIIVTIKVAISHCFQLNSISLNCFNKIIHFSQRSSTSINEGFCITNSLIFISDSVDFCKS